MSEPSSLFRLSRAAYYALGGFALFFALHRLTSGGAGQMRDALLFGLAGAATVMFVAWSFARSASSATQPAFSLNGLDFKAAAENSLDDFYIFDGVEDANGKLIDFRFIYINPAAERRLNAEHGSLLGKTLSEVRPDAVTLGLIERYAEVVRTGQPSAEEVFLNDDRVTSTWLHVHAVKLGNGVAITSRDITERKEITDRASYLALHDHLTGLANRTLLLTRMKSAIAQAQSTEQKVAVFVIDLDNFKKINDSLGHLIGDRILTIIAKILSGAVRDTDTVARLGGDEFVIVMPSFKDLADVDRCARKIVSAVDRTITIEGHKINTTISIGYSIYPDSGITTEQLLMNADMAMYSVKSEGRNGFRSFDPTRETSPAETLARANG
ncbi:MAG TPA: GGDEF domain-containing protein [Edaphobacter sp.]